MSSCKCGKCGNDTSSNEFSYMYRQKNGKSVFTGFLQKNNDVNQIYWVGKDEKTKPKHINVENPEDTAFFMKQMRQYD